MAADNLAQQAEGEAAPALIDKLEVLARRYTAARGDFQRSEVDEALNRTRLGVALADAMLARARVEQEARDIALVGYRAAAARFARPRRRNRVARGIDRVLDLGRSSGRAMVIARSGVWEGGDLRAMAAYARRGADPAVQPSAIFDQAWYLKGRADLAGSRNSPLVHYLLHGGAEGASPHPLFDSGYYASRNAADLAATGLTPLEHFVRVGAAEGRDPHPLFSIGHYVRQAPDLIASGGNPITHYLQVGWRRGLSPHPLFAADFYAAQIGAGGPEVAPLVHYLTEGVFNGLRPHPLFDPAWYRDQNPDVIDGGFEPLSHYAAAGGAEGRHPSPWFDAHRYGAQRGVDLPPGVNLLVDYLQGGAWSIGEPWPGKTTIAFLAAASELALSGMTPLEHWARQGDLQTPSALSPVQTSR
ncbi:hypothetical protein [Phenylobacterium sp.]|uniref:hypothetical protein n=1 Tax=Phenylobacterium sp. TaxID=1871053 RepID=UPI002730C5E9|nr:hypothetical protein [Phenylobacterium sp.]MDP1600726.1 hypothetical protein [Phenylobacterium sp.]